MDERDVDAEFEAIIAGWDEIPSVADERVDHPDDADHPDRADETATDGPDNPVVNPPWTDPARPPAAPAEGGWRVHPPLLDDDKQATEPSAASAADEDDDEEHFVPQPVTLPPQEDLHFWGIVVGLVAGPLLLLWLILVGGGVYASWWLLLAIGLTVGGFTLLVLRQPTRRDPDDHDDGARL